MFRQDQIPNNNPYTPLGIVLSAGRALLDSVVQPLRAVSVDASWHRFQVFFIYDEPLTEDQEEECRCVGTELLADYPESVEVFQEIFVHQPMPEAIVAPGVLAYLRHEEPAQEEAIASGSKIRDVLFKAPLTRPYILFAADRALLGEVTPSLRNVTVEWDGSKVHLDFYYDGSITQQEEAIANRVVGRVGSWLSGAEVSATVERLDPPQRSALRPTSGDTRLTVYARWEPTPQ
ncbi:MAG: hypothetical protein ACOYKZ_00975 [Chlamydiia bacterium]